MLAAGASTSTKHSKEFTIKAIEAKLKALESKADDLEINKTTSSEVPLIYKYQYNKASSDRPNDRSMKLIANKGKYSTGPYNRHQRRNKR